MSTTDTHDNDGNRDNEVLASSMMVATTATGTSSKAAASRRAKRKRETKHILINNDNKKLSLKDDSDSSDDDSEATFQSTESYCEALLHQTEIEIQECQEKELRLYQQLAKKRDHRLRKEKKTGRQYDEVKWMEMYLRLREYKRSHNEREPGRKNPSNDFFKLGLWVNNQRRYYRQDKQLPHRIELLKQINFQFTPQQQLNHKQTDNETQPKNNQGTIQQKIQETQQVDDQTSKRNHPTSTATTNTKKRKKTNSSSSSTTSPKKKKRKKQKQHDNGTNKELIV